MYRRQRPPRLPNRRAARRAGGEFSGNVQENTVQPKVDAALSASEQLRLGYLTQSDSRGDEPTDEGRSFRGFGYRFRIRRRRYPLP
jgi:hypothetical protein